MAIQIQQKLVIEQDHLKKILSIFFNEKTTVRNYNMYLLDRKLYLQAHYILLVFYFRFNIIQRK